MLFPVELNQTKSPTSKLFLQFLNHVLSWMFECQDVISTKPGFALTQWK